MRILYPVIVCLLIVGCAYLNPNHTFTIEECSDRIAMGLSRGLEDSHMGVSILVSTPVDAVTFAPSDFGLALQEFLISSMAKRNTNVVDVQLRHEPYITCEQGLITLSRDASRLKGEFRAEVIIVSTYVESDEDVAIISRAIDFTTNDVITSTTTILDKSLLIDDLLNSRRQFRIYER